MTKREKTTERRCNNKTKKETQGSIYSRTTVSNAKIGNIGSRAFSIAGTRIWNTLYRCTSPLPHRWLHLNSTLNCTCFVFSLPGLSPVWLLCDPWSVCCHLGHCKKLTDCRLIGWNRIKNETTMRERERESRESYVQSKNGVNQCITY